MPKSRWLIVISLVILSSLATGWLNDEGWVHDTTVNMYPAVKYALPDSGIGQQVAGVSDDVVNASGETDVPNCVAMLQPDSGEPEWVWCDNGYTEGSYDELVHGGIVETAQILDAEQRATQFTLMSTVEVKRLYKWPNRGGNVFSGVTSHTAGCSDGSQYWMSNYAPYNWNNVTSSMEPIGSCGSLTGYANTSYTGASLSGGYYSDLSQNGFDNELESTKAKR